MIEFLIFLIIIIIIILVYYFYNKNTPKLNDSSVLIKKTNLHTYGSIFEPDDINNVHNITDISRIQNIRNQQILENEPLSEYEVKKVKPYKSISNNKRIDLNNLNSDLIDIN